ncbi:hypothetical protein [Neorhizobium galegae]|uniref:hypothetical protein n=1 Tax=Neorhizobium galegae TaxID=399 RepID=UPI00138E1C71|nr:hypothetical protein [Neorhizobium galegae]
MNTFAVEVLTYHAALELEVDAVLKKLLPFAEKITEGRGRLGFQHKVSVLGAAWLGKPASADKLTVALIRFNDLRNAVAHNDGKQVRACMEGLRKACRSIDKDLPADASILALSQAICAYMGDENLAKMLKLLEILDEIVNVRMPKALGGKK